MKVVGRGVNGKFLIEASGNEIANICGFYYLTTFNENRAKKGLPYVEGDKLIGLEINTSEAYENLSWFLQRKEEFDDTICLLRRMADKLENPPPVFSLPEA